MGQGGLHHRQGARHLGVEALAQRLGRELGEGAAAEAAGVVDHGVEASMPVHDLFDHPIDLAPVGHVAEAIAGAMAAKGIDCVAACRLVPPNHHGHGAFVGGRFGDRAADASVGAGDQHHAALKVQIHRVPPSRETTLSMGRPQWA